MKNDAPKFKLFYYLKQLFHNENPDKKSEVEKRKVAVENNLRWQDDGGPAIDTRPIDPPAQNDPAQSTDEAGKVTL